MTGLFVNAMKVVLKVVIPVLLVGGIFVAGAMFGPLYKAASSVVKIEDGLYSFEFKGDDGMDGLLEEGGASSSGEMVPYITDFLTKGFVTSSTANPVSPDYGCSTLKVRSADGAVLMGRNFDWSQSLCIVAHVKPKGGYEYVSAFDGNLLGMGDGWKPEGFMDKIKALSCLFFALDGINEKGLAIADLMAGDSDETHQNSGKPDLTTSSALKYMLSKAADIDEAVALLGTIDMHSDVGSAHHYSMADASGRSVVVEYVDDRIVVTETQVVTNHYLCDRKYLVGKKQGDFRQEKLEEVYGLTGGVMNEDELFGAMKMVWQYGHGDDSFSGTQWTEVFNLSEPSMALCFDRNEASLHRFELGGKKTAKEK